ncbi:flocculation protein FLO11-like [Cucumis melo var. makuwa]|uniref:Flocculation protein FLO11-like n=1 Tax=Cucumis melo var. makuwa TaxID=1194695 RepID=A0A5A7UW36_CUCMM|nr:flocculation protein FLO11-like [Cucumis melo var. makuwa]
MDTTALTCAQNSYVDHSTTMHDPSIPSPTRTATQDDNSPTVSVDTINVDSDSNSLEEFDNVVLSKLLSRSHRLDVTMNTPRCISTHMSGERISPDSSSSPTVSAKNVSSHVASLHLSYLNIIPSDPLVTEKNPPSPSRYDSPFNVVPPVLGVNSTTTLPPVLLVGPHDLSVPGYAPSAMPSAGVMGSSFMPKVMRKPLVKDNVHKRKYVVQHCIANEFISELVVNLPSDFNDPSANEFHKVHVHGVCFTISLSLLNQFLGMSLPGDSFVSYPSLKRLDMELTSGTLCAFLRSHPTILSALDVAGPALKTMTLSFSCFKGSMFLTCLWIYVLLLVVPATSLQMSLVLS